jgi:hypothetical protein
MNMSTSIPISTQDLYAKFKSQEWTSFTGCPRFEVKPATEDTNQLTVTLSSTFKRGETWYRFDEDLPLYFAAQFTKSKMSSVSPKAFSGPSGVSMSEGVREIIVAGMEGVMRQIELDNDPDYRSVAIEAGTSKAKERSFTLRQEIKPRFGRKKTVELEFVWDGSLAKSKQGRGAVVVATTGADWSAMAGENEV